MDHNNPQELKLAIRKCVIAFVVILIGTALTVTAAQIRLGPHSINVAVALAISLVQASLVAGFLMQLVSEHKMILWVLALTGLFFVVLFALIAGSYSDHTSHLFGR
jgi:caa(3)-type oxidase subunit IV